jgi:hypothetical protein
MNPATQKILFGIILLIISGLKKQALKIIPGWY